MSTDSDTPLVAASPRIEKRHHISRSHKFNQLAAPIEQKVSAPWLRKRKFPVEDEQINVVDLDRHVERPATPEEIETGVYAEDLAEYQKLTGRAA